ncbi:MAG TPA: DUF362 domain-containing protein [Desulfosarcina sp.]|nr:DUF362 domain-containing protein [Desulfosarcina sp.]
MCRGLKGVDASTRVFIKPNVVFWTRAAAFPNWGVITTSRVVEDMVRLLTSRGVGHITIGEGMVTREPKDTATPAHAFETLGYRTLERRYGVQVVNVFERSFEAVDLGDGITLNFNTDILNCDLVVDLPAMKAHNQTVVSLGIKNLKGTIDIPSRKRCHNPDRQKNLDYMVARLADRLPPVFTLIDGIYTLERGPGPDGGMRRSDSLVASADILSADMVGARLLGHSPQQVPHLAMAAANRGRPADLSDIEVVGEPLDSLVRRHEFDFPYASDDSGELPLTLARQGIQGVFYRKFDDTMCTYCSALNGLTLSAIRFAWKGEPWDRLEVLTGKRMQPTPGMARTLLLGKCMYRKHKDNPDINEMIAVKGCPPRPQDVADALHRAGIAVDPALFDNIDQLPGVYMARYANRPEFEEGFFRVES